MGARAYARNRNVQCAHAHDARLLAKKPVHLLNDAFIELVGLPTTYGPAPNLI
jgi:hypothetical protein